MLFSQLYLQNYISIKRLGDYIKIVRLPVCRQAGFDKGNMRSSSDNKDEADSSKGEKLSNSISRARSKIFEYAMCNPFDHFVTLTLSPEKYNRYDLDSFYKDFSQFIRNQRRLHNINIQYLYIPELHMDNAWHLHGLSMGIDKSLLRLFTNNEQLPYNILNKLEQGRLIYDWPDYAKRFGYVTFEPIRDKEAVSKYITKYIGKNLETSITELNRKLYYTSRGLKSAKEIYKAPISFDISSYKFDYSGEYCDISTVPITKFMSDPQYSPFLNEVLENGTQIGIANLLEDL